MTPHCRGCGGMLNNRRAKFHPECLVTDKSDRTREDRAKAQRARHQYHLRQPCPCCHQRIARHGSRSLLDQIAEVLLLIRQVGFGRSDAGQIVQVAVDSEGKRGIGDLIDDLLRRYDRAQAVQPVAGSQEPACETSQRPTESSAEATTI